MDLNIVTLLLFSLIFILDSSFTRIENKIPSCNGLCGLYLQLWNCFYLNSAAKLNFVSFLWCSAWWMPTKWSRNCQETHPQTHFFKMFSDAVYTVLIDYWWYSSLPLVWMVWLRNPSWNLPIPKPYKRKTCFSFHHHFHLFFLPVLRAIHLPGLDHTGYSDPYVALELLPKPLFQNFTKQKTRVAKETLNPIFNQLFLMWASFIHSHTKRHIHLDG